MEAEVVRAAVDNAARGPAAVAEVVNAGLERARLEYERRLAFLGTLGNNAPFIGLFGTVLGIIRGFADLAANPGAAGAGSVMAGISEALVATADGLAVALPAVVSFNLFQRWLRRSAQRSAMLGHALGPGSRRGRGPRAVSGHVGGGREGDDGLITGINVTPLVDVVVVLLIKEI